MAGLIVRQGQQYLSGPTDSTQDLALLQDSSAGTGDTQVVEATPATYSGRMTSDAARPEGQATPSLKSRVSEQCPPTDHGMSGQAVTPSGTALLFPTKAIHVVKANEKFTKAFTYFSCFIFQRRPHASPPSPPDRLRHRCLQPSQPPSFASFTARPCCCDGSTPSSSRIRAAPGHDVSIRCQWR